MYSGMPKWIGCCGLHVLTVCSEKGHLQHIACRTYPPSYVYSYGLFFTLSLSRSSRVNKGQGRSLRLFRSASFRVIFTSLPWTLWEQRRITAETWHRRPDADDVISVSWMERSTRGGWHVSFTLHLAGFFIHPWLYLSLWEYLLCTLI